MLYIRGNRRDFDNWEAMGNPGWSYDDVLPYFKKSENYRSPLDSSTGFSIFDLTTENGFRESVAEAFIKPNLRRANFDVMIHSHVAKILFDENKRAIGVMYYHKKKIAYARKEVILCAGAIDSPKLLMLSGVGPSAHLNEVNFRFCVNKE
ncbi:Glucose dehydrogenase [FAD, quinone] [Armadillidium vulgare]|nr:Glucose dehydrogenase [FAD, quinone] [Armadillidium vulgare]